MLYESKDEGCNFVGGRRLAKDGETVTDCPDRFRGKLGVDIRLILASIEGQRR